MAPEKLKLNVYGDGYTDKPVYSSKDLGWMGVRLEYFEAPGSFQPELSYAEHHLMINLLERHHLRQKRDGKWVDLHMKKGDFVLTPAKMRNAWEWRDRSKVMALTLSPIFLQNFAGNELAVKLEDEQLMGKTDGHDPLLNNLAEILLNETKTDKPNHPLYTQSIVNALLVHLLQNYSLKPTSNLPVFQKSFSPQQYNRVLDYIQHNFEKDIHLEDLANQAGISPFQFSRVFKESMGITPHQYLVACRVEKAKKLLLNQDLSIADVAFQTGFADQSHLNKHFKAKLGITPAFYRTRQ